MSPGAAEDPARLAGCRRAARANARRPFRTRLRLVAGADQNAGDVNEVAVRSYLIESPLWDHDRERAFERHRQLDQIERIGGQIVAQGDVGKELVHPHTETLGDEESHMRFHEFIQAQPAQPRGNP